MITFAPSKAFTLVPLLALALTACAETAPPPRTGLTARADNGTRSDATGSQVGMITTPQKSANQSVVQISDEILAACSIGRGDAYFATDSYTLQSNDVPVLDKVAACFTTGALKGRGVRLVGHADPRGPSEYNTILGQNRADSVSTYLRRKGVPSAQAEATSRGAMDATGTNEPTWAQDRRVDVMLGR